jgi:dolichol kinase
MTNTSQATLDGLVEGTRGFQPYRKLFHAVNAVVISTALTVLDLPRTWELAILGGLFLVLLAGDLIRLAVPRANHFFYSAFQALASPREVSGLASSTWYALGVFVAVLVAPRAAAISSILVLGLADPVASWVGVRWGRRAFLGGTLEGSVAFVCVAAVVLFVRHPSAAALAIAIVAGLAERRSWPLDDNLAIPVVCAVLLRVWVG